MSYALARSLNAPLLYKGDDFAVTDIASCLFGEASDVSRRLFEASLKGSRSMGGAGVIPLDIGPCVLLPYFISLDDFAIFRDIIAMKTIILTTAAARDLDALPAPTREQIFEALARFVVEGKGDVKKLSGRHGYRLRIGAYRVIFTRDTTTILAVYIGRRQTVAYSRN